VSRGATPVLPFFKDQRGYVRSALEYAHNQRDALMRFLDDGRLGLENSRSERAIKSVVLGRKARLFCGSDDHAKSTAALFSIVASARLHRLDPEEYVRPRAAPSRDPRQPRPHAGRGISCGSKMSSPSIAARAAALR
jgi:hypothetical protein